MWRYITVLARLASIVSQIYVKLYSRNGYYLFSFYLIARRA